MAIEAQDYIFEASWEVCNKIGGIYTVLSTKAKTLQKLHKDHIIFLGQDVWTTEHPAPDFEESTTLLKKWRETALLPEGMEVRVGRWEQTVVSYTAFPPSPAYDCRLYISVALALESPPPDVIRHPAL